MRILVPGGKLNFEEGYSDKFSDAMDNYLISSITGHFGVLPSEIGFNGAGSLGASGIQQGESESGEAIGIIPTANWISQMISALSYRFLGMPRELEFRLAPSERTNTQEAAARDDIRKRNGAITVNENRAELGLPLVDTPEADMPMLVAGNSVYFFGPEGVQPAVEPVDPLAGMSFGDTPEDSKPVEDDLKPAEPKPAEEEVKKFIRFIRKGTPTRPFEFKELDETYAEILNKFIETKDVDGARWYAEHYLGI
jgi:hypothetical protein